jgi:hypothetical protein
MTDPTMARIVTELDARVQQQSAEITRLGAAWENEAIITRDLRARVAELGEIANVCTYDTLGAVCSYCRCQRRQFTDPALTSGQGTE